MKKIFLLVVLLIMAAGFAGCRKESTESPSPTEAAAPATKPTEVPSPTAAASDETPSPTAEPTEIPTPTEIILPDNAGDFKTSSMAFYWDESSERHNILAYIFPVDNNRAVIQLSSLEAPEDEEIGSETNCSLTLELINKAMYRNDESGITLFIDNENNVTLTAENEKYSLYEGSFSPLDSTGWATDDTILEFLRNIPGSGIGDFGRTGNKDEVEECFTDEWFHELRLLRDGELYAAYAATEDMTAICRLNGEKCELIYGSMASTLEKTNIFDFIGGDENGEDYYFFEQPIVYPCIQNGTYMYVGMSDSVVVNAALDMTESISVTSSDENVIKAEGAEVTATGAGEAVLDVELVYGGCTKQYTIEVTVTEEYPEMTDEIAEYQDQDLIELIDTVTYKYTMSIYNDEGFYSVDIISVVSPDTYRHWSYYGEEDSSDPSVIDLIGSCTLETYNVDGSYSEETEFEGMAATVTRNSDGSYLWYDSYANEGEMSVFK
ncbi:MAG: hypothetical protein ILP22_04365 [Oscillospiraceae bacterium]|nr:hypothetical protein [Oscillospiraceae bacterium]